MFLAGALCLAAPPSASDMARTIDQRLEAVWQLEKVAPARQCSAAAFVRRVSLDLAGRIPTAVEARRFARSDSQARRQQLVKQLAQNAASDIKLAETLRKIWFPQTDVVPYRYLAADTTRWIARQLRLRRPLNEIARALIAVPEGGTDFSTGVAMTGSAQAAIEAARRRQRPPRTFIAANDHRPDRMADNAVGHFLGVDLSCAQCHDHPFGSWTQDQFWQTAAFFKRSKPSPGEKLQLQTLSIAVPGGRRQASAALFTGKDLDAGIVAQATNGRAAFASWISDPRNPYFARHTVNQLWETYFGRPLVTSLYDYSPEEAALASLLDEIAAALIEHQFSSSWLVRTMLQTRAYQASSVTTDITQPEVAQRYFALATVRGLSGKQLFDSLLTAAGKPLVREDIDSPLLVHQRQQFDSEFQMAKVSQPQRSVTQTLKLMNGRLAQQLQSGAENATVTALAGATFIAEDDCITTIFQAALARAPTADELKQLRAAGLHRDDLASRAERYRVVFWLLTNTVEFSTNH